MSRPQCETAACIREAVTSTDVPNVGLRFVCELHAPAGSVVTR